MAVVRSDGHGDMKLLALSQRSSVVEYTTLLGKKKSCNHSLTKEHKELLVAPKTHGDSEANSFNIFIFSIM